MKVRYSLVFDRKKVIQSKGIGLVQIQAYLNGNRRYFTTKLYLKHNEWDVKRNTTKDPYLGKSLREMITKFENFEVEYRALNQNFALADFDLLFDRKVEKTRITFTEFYQQQLEKEKHLAHGTLMNQKNTLHVLSEFQSSVSFEDLNYETIQNFENYLRVVKKHKVNTIEKYHRNVRKYINLAIKKELLAADKNPYKNYKLVTEETDTLFLSIEEQKRVEFLEFEEHEKDLEVARDMFLFSCYTGLRFSDAYSLIGADFQETTNGLVLKFKSQKTNKIGYQPLFVLFNGKPQIIAQKYIRRNLKEALFKGFYNSRVNKLLKIIAQKAKVNRGLYFKASRDTFGTTLYMLSGDQKLVQNQLQHSKREQTDKYVHISDQIQNESLKKAFKTK
jgi:integrase